MPYVQRDTADRITGAFNQFQEGIAEEFMTEEAYNTYKSSITPVSFIRKSPGRLFLDQIGLTPVWGKVYYCATQSIAVQAGMTLLLSAVTAEFAIEFFIRPFRDMIEAIQNDENLPDLTEEDISTLRSRLEGNGFNSSLFLD